MILVVGKKQPRSKRLQCEGCASELEYLESDVRKESVGTSIYRYVDCPVKRCLRANYLGTEESR